MIKKWKLENLSKELKVKKYSNKNFRIKINAIKSNFVFPSFVFQQKNSYKCNLHWFVVIATFLAKLVKEALFNVFNSLFNWIPFISIPQIEYTCISKKPQLTHFLKVLNMQQRSLMHQNLHFLKSSIPSPPQKRFINVILLNATSENVPFQHAHLCNSEL